MGKTEAERWAQSLSTALQRWCDTHGYEIRVYLADELAIPRTAWKRIVAGQAIVGEADPTAYAKIYVRTGLAEADPRYIPPLLKKIPSAEEPVEVPRSWSPEEFEDWLNKLAKLGLSVRTSTVDGPGETADSSTDLVARLAGRLTKELWGFMWSQNAEKRTELMKSLGRGALGELHYMLNALVQETPKQRERAVKRWQLSRRMSGEVQDD
jgi:hypothetical protein